MSQGTFLQDAKYETDTGVVHPIRIQPETPSLTLNAVANAQPAGAVGSNLPSARVSSGRNSFGINARLVRFRFTGTLPPGYAMNGILTLPVLTPTAFNSFGKSQTGTYTLEGTDYDIAFVGKTPETIK